MCRLLGVVTPAPIRLADSLADLVEPFTGLSREHRDGWGIAAWRTDGELAVAKEVLAAHASEAFPKALAETVTDAALLHIRMASPGLPTEPRNTHPFSAGAIAFAHNGWFTPVDAVDALIGPELLAAARGDTDSERYFLRVLARLRTEDPVDALARAAADIRAHAGFASLNCLLLTPQALYAYADEDPDSEVSRRRGPDFFRLRYQADAERAVVASSGIGPQPEQAGWSVLPYRQVLEIRRADLRVSTHRVQTG
ncbi:class II glutamine amidotransferase [Kitasatospora sp. NBC_01287]|uniref:class II glutamine amidotransferase n=1 Tax=Kitasatospora sp. NBC_01287 TaxID=2903573 RepID=UPI00225909D1|nr:class II glutamine amidotransferase [Kitasatospora sp. NBC_01287]MCX4745725.1 class II glutamine amidotransferase [Kitasatospora sp. NBC_01287]